MKTKTLLTTALICCFAICLAAAIDLSGKWVGSVTGPDGNTIQLNYNFKADGNNLTGSLTVQDEEDKIDSGQITGNNFKFSITNSQGVLIHHWGKFYTDSIGMNIDYMGTKYHSTLVKEK